MSAPFAPAEAPLPGNERRGQDPREQGRDVIITLRSGPREIVLGAHFGAVQLRDGGLSVGMVDNAAGTVVLVRVAAALRKQRLRHRVRVVFFDMAEIRLVGSTRFVRSLEPSQDAAMGTGHRRVGNTVIFGPVTHPGNTEICGSMWRSCAQQNFACVKLANFPPSDDRSFQAAEIPNISLAIVPRVETHQLRPLSNGGPESGLREGFAPQALRTIHTSGNLPEMLDPASTALAYNAPVSLAFQLDSALRCWTLADV